MDLPLSFLTWIPLRLWEAVTGRIRCRLTVHYAHFAATGTPCYFVNLTNRSKNRDVEVTHVWFAADPDVHANPADRPLPKRLKPDESWGTWVEARTLPPHLGDRVFTLARARISTGEVLRSRKNRNVPSQGSIPGGILNTPP